MPKDHDYFARATDFYGFDPKLDEPLYVARPGELIGLGADAALWRSADGVRAEIVAPPEVAVLSLCRTFGRREELVDRVTAATGQPRTAVVDAIDAAIVRGLLARPTDFLGSDRASESSAPQPLVLLRAGRGFPALLDSLARHDAQAGQRRYVVCAAGADPGADSHWRELASEFARSRGANLRFVGTRECEALAGQWFAPLDAPARDAMEALLAPTRVGPEAAAWNWALLLGAGGTIAVFGDDARFPVRVPVGWDSRLELFDSPVAAARFFDDDDELAGLYPYEGDPLAFAARYVGQPARALIRAGDSRFLELWEAEAREVAHVTERARVAGAIAGLWGEFDQARSVLLELAERGSLRDLWREPYRADRLDGSRMWHGVRVPRLLSTTGARQPLVLDNRHPLAFAPGPAGPGADLTLLALVRALAPESRVVFVPLLMGRATAEGQHVPETDGDAALVLAQLLDGIGGALQSAQPQARLRALGIICAEHAHAAAGALSDLILRIQLAARCDRVRRLSELVKDHPRAPAQWRERVGAESDAERASLATAAPAPRTVEGVRGALDLIARAADAWPVVWARAREQAED